MIAGGNALAATIYSPRSVAYDFNADFFFTDSTAHVLRKVTNGTGLISNIAGKRPGTDMLLLSLPAPHARRGLATAAPCDRHGHSRVLGRRQYVAVHGFHRGNQHAHGTCSGLTGAHLLLRLGQFHHPPGARHWYATECVFARDCRKLPSCGPKGPRRMVRTACLLLCV